MRLRNLSLPTLALAVCSVSAFATPITNGATGVVPSTTTLGTFTTVATTGPVTVVSNGAGNPSTFTATYTESIIRTASNPFGANDLTFTMVFSNSAGSADYLERATNGFGAGFSNFSSDVDYVAGTGGVPTTSDEKFGTIGFNFANGIAPGTSSDIFVIYTNATNYSTANFSLIDNQTATGLGYVPAPALATTPEPSALVLLGTGMLGLAGAARRRFQK